MCKEKISAAQLSADDNALQVCLEAVKESPSGLAVYIYRPPETLLLMYANPSMEQIFGLDLTSKIGEEYNDIWPSKHIDNMKARHLEAMKDNKVVTTRRLVYGSGPSTRMVNIRSFPLSNERLGVAVEDITDLWNESEMRSRAYEQVEKNIEDFAMLIDEIRNPISVIMHNAVQDADCHPQQIVEQVKRIEHIVSQLEEGWMRSEHVRIFWTDIGRPNRISSGQDQTCRTVAYHDGKGSKAIETEPACKPRNEFTGRSFRMILYPGISAILVNHPALACGASCFDQSACCTCADGCSGRLSSACLMVDIICNAL